MRADDPRAEWQRLRARRTRGLTIPRSIPPGRVLMHNHVVHGPDWVCGLNGFRCWTADARFADFEECPCGYGGLKHYARKEHVSTGVTIRRDACAGHKRRCRGQSSCPERRPTPFPEFRPVAHPDLRRTCARVRIVRGRHLGLPPFETSSQPQHNLAAYPSRAGTSHPEGTENGRRLCRQEDVKSALPLHNHRAGKRPPHPQAVPQLRR